MRRIVVFILLICAAAATHFPGNAADTKNDHETSISVQENKTGKPDHKPYNSEAIKHYNRGVELHGQGFLNHAIEEYKIAIKDDPRMEEAYSNLAGIYSAQHDWVNAEDTYCEALKLRSDRPTTLNGYATVLWHHGKHQEAVQYWEKVIKVEPNFSSAKENLDMARRYEEQNKGKATE